MARAGITPYKEFGRFWGFEIGLFTWLQGAAAIATEIAAFLRGLRPWLPRLSEITVYRWAGLGMILILLTIRLLGKKASTWANNFSTVLKLAVLGLFVVLGIFTSSRATLMLRSIIRLVTLIMHLC